MFQVQRPLKTIQTSVTVPPDEGEETKFVCMHCQCEENEPSETPSRAGRQNNRATEPFQNNGYNLIRSCIDVLSATGRDGARDTSQPKHLSTEDNTQAQAQARLPVRLYAPLPHQ